MVDGSDPNNLEVYAMPIAFVILILIVVVLLLLR